VPFRAHHVSLGRLRQRRGRELGETLAVVEEVGEAELLLDHVLLEQGRQDDGGRAGVLERPESVEGAGEGTGGGDHGPRQLEPEVARRQVGGHGVSSSTAVRSTPANWL